MYFNEFTIIMRHDIFPTSVWHIEGTPQQLLDDLCKNISSIKENIHLYQTTEKTTVSNQGGYQTAQFSQEEFHPAGIEYIENIVDNIISSKDSSWHYVSQHRLLQVNITGWWYNINPKGAWNVPHSHGGADYALVWYLTDSDGLLQLMNPHTSRKNSQDVSFNAKKGDILIFPGDIIHYVMPNTKEEDRVCISMNLLLS